MARRIVRLREDHRTLVVRETGTSSGPSVTLLESLYWPPIVTVQRVSEKTKLAFSNANKLVNRFVARELREIGQ